MKHRMHLRKHTRPFECDVVDCVQSFALKEDLKRHLNSKHSEAAHQRRWYCSVPGCSYKLAWEGTSRKDSLDRHIRTRHGQPDL